MASPAHSNPSLRWKLSWQLSAVFVAVVATVIVGICVYGVMILSPNVGLMHRVTETLDASLERGGQQELVIADTQALDALKADIPDLWFYAVDREGRSVRYGSIPAAYEDLTRYVHLMQDADIRGSVATDEVASIDSIASSVGEIRVLYGGSTSTTSTFLTMLFGTYRIYVPLLAVAVPAIFLAVPRIVGNALAGLSSVVRRASEIDPKHPGSRLPIENVPKEVVPLIVAFNAVLERLEDQFQARQRFLIDAAHELRTPIAIMQTRIEGMPDSRERRRLMDDVARLGGMAEQLLAFERDSQADDVRETIDLVEMTRAVVADLAPLAIAAGYEISFDSEVETLAIEGNPSALPRAVSNLVRNAIDHAGAAGAITVAVSRSREITVTDEGPGIPEGQKEKVFEPFYRITPSSKGAGLGLSLVKQIVTNHGGQVSLGNGAAGAVAKIQL